MFEKKILMCVEPEMVYIDSDMGIWEPITRIETPCAMCETSAPGGRVYENVVIEEVICENCVNTIVPADAIEAYETVNRLAKEK